MTLLERVIQADTEQLVEVLDFFDVDGLRQDYEGLLEMIRQELRRRGVLR